MSYFDAFQEPIDIGDYILYSNSNCMRLAKILDIIPAPITGYYSMSKIILMTASGKGTFRREGRQWSRTPDVAFFATAKVDSRLYPELKDRIEQRLARKK